MACYCSVCLRCCSRRRRRRREPELQHAPDRRQRSAGPTLTNAAGQANFKLSNDGTELEYKLIASNIENVVAAHIHVGAEGVNGPVVAFLYGPAAPGGGRTNGVLATGTITAANLVGPLAGQPLSALIDADRGGERVRERPHE